MPNGILSEGALQLRSVAAPSKVIANRAAARYILGQLALEPLPRGFRGENSNQAWRPAVKTRGACNEAVSRRLRARSAADWPEQARAAGWAAVVCYERIRRR